MRTSSLAEPLPLRADPVVIRRFRPGDLERFRAYRCDPGVGRFQGWSAMTTSEALAFIDKMAFRDLFCAGEWVQLAIADALDDTLVGDLGLFVAQMFQHAEVGFTISPSAQGRGYATAAVSAAILLLFEHTQVPRVLGVTDARNSASIRVLERVGMSRIETREAVFKGEPCTEWVYARER